jgi:hypothetical protein
MQLKIVLLAALSKGKPLLLCLWGLDKRLSAIGRNACAAIEMLEPQQRNMVKVFVHGWGFHEAPFLVEAIKYAHEGRTIDEAISACTKIADHHFCFSNFLTSATVKKLLKWRPGLFEQGFNVEDDSFIGFGIPVTIREEVLDEFERAGRLMNVQLKEKSMSAFRMQRLPESKVI